MSEYKNNKSIFRQNEGMGAFGEQKEVQTRLLWPLDDERKFESAKAMAQQLLGWGGPDLTQEELVFSQKYGIALAEADGRFDGLNREFRERGGGGTGLDIGLDSDLGLHVTMTPPLQEGKNAV